MPFYYRNALIASDLGKKDSCSFVENKQASAGAMLSSVFPDLPDRFFPF